MSMFYSGISPYTNSPNVYGYPQTQQQYSPSSYSSNYGMNTGSGYGSGSQNSLLSYLFGALGGIPHYGGSNYSGSSGYPGNTGGFTQYGPLSPYSPFPEPAKADINVQAHSPFGYAQSLGHAFSGYYANTTGNAFTNILGAGAQNSAIAYNPMASMGGYGNYGSSYGNGYGGGYGGGSNFPTQTYSQSIANGMNQYTQTSPSYPPVVMPPIYSPTPQPIYNYGNSTTSAVAGPGAYANGTAGI